MKVLTSGGRQKEWKKREGLKWFNNSFVFCQEWKQKLIVLLSQKENSASFAKFHLILKKKKRTTPPNKKLTR